jgi:hypothetical protein
MDPQVIEDLINKFAESRRLLRTAIVDDIKSQSTEDNLKKDLEEADCMPIHDLIWWWRSDWSKDR